MKKVSVIVPVYYNEESLPVLFKELSEVEEKLLEQQVEMELIFINDGSGDNSLQELLNIKKKRSNIKIISLTRNFGAIHASKTGFLHVTGDCFLVLAADLQDPPFLIIEMVEKWLQGSKFVICVRKSRQDPIISKVFSYLYYHLLRLFVIPDYPNSGYDLSLMDKVFLPYLINSSKNINTPLFAYWLGFKPDVLFYKRRARIHGKSRWTFAKKLKFFIDSFLGFSVIPIRLISLIGIFISCASFVYGFVIVSNALLGHIQAPGFATITSLILFLLGLIIIMLGIIGEYLWRIFDEINKRPESVIDEIY